MSVIGGEGGRGRYDWFHCLKQVLALKSYTLEEYAELSDGLKTFVVMLGFDPSFMSPSDKSASSCLSTRRGGFMEAKLVLDFH